MTGVHREWMPTHKSIGDSISKLIGAQEYEVTVTDSTSVNLFKLTVAALRARPERTKIVSDVFNFPSDLYVFQGIIDMLGNKHRLHLIPSEDSIHISQEAIDDAIVEENIYELIPQRIKVEFNLISAGEAWFYKMAIVWQDYLNLLDDGPVWLIWRYRWLHY